MAASAAKLREWRRVEKREDSAMTNDETRMTKEAPNPARPVSVEGSDFELRAACVQAPTRGGGFWREKHIRLVASSAMALATIRELTLELRAYRQVRHWKFGFPAPWGD